MVSLLGLPLTVTAQTNPQTIQDQELQRAREREKALQQQQPQAPDVRLDNQGAQVAAQIIKLPLTESTPAFPISRVILDGEESWRFQFALKKGLQQTGLRQLQIDGQWRLMQQDTMSNAGVVMGANSVNALMGVIQNHLIARGYTTTRVLAAPQDLRSGVLRLTVIPGRVADVLMDTQAVDATSHRATLRNVLPIRRSQILNLRDIEQGLENLKRVPTADADIQITPGAEPNTSNLVVRWKQRQIPARLTLSLDDSGGERTGKYQGGVTLSLDHPLRLNDLFYVNVGGALADLGNVRVYDAEDHLIDDRHGQTRNWSAHYSLPFGYWMLALQASKYRYEQAVLGVNQAYQYSGTSRTQDIKLSRLFYRDAKRKSTASLKLWSRQSNNFIEDAEIEVQRRRTAGFELGLAHREYIRNQTLDLAVAYRRGTGADDALRAPEEGFDEGTSRMQLYTADINWNVPIEYAGVKWNLSSNWHGQWNGSRLVQQDKLAIGGRYSVRGFDGEYTLAGERGWIWRNEAARSLSAAHQVYAAVDVGHVAGRGSKLLLGKSLAGAALGMRGQFRLGGALSYDVFVATPLSHPAYFPVSDVTAGFSLNWSL